MSEEHDRDVQQWFSRSADASADESAEESVEASTDELSLLPFTRAVLQQIQRRERRLLLERYVVWLVAFVSFCLLMRELIVPLNMLAALPSAVIEIGGKQWSMLQVMVMAMAVGCWIFKQTLDPGFTRRLLAQVTQR